MHAHQANLDWEDGSSLTPQNEHSDQLRFWNNLILLAISPLDRVYTPIGESSLGRVVSSKSFIAPVKYELSPFWLIRNLTSAKKWNQYLSVYDIPKERYQDMQIQAFEIVEGGLSEAAEKKASNAQLKWVSELEDEKVFEPFERIPVHWSFKEVETVDLHYRILSENSWIEIAKEISADLLSYDMFLAPSLISDSLIIRVRSTNNPELHSYSEAIWVLDRAKALANGELPMEFELFQNYPNPFNPVTTISYSLPELSFVTIEVYNSIGQQVDVLVNQNQQSGYYEVSWNGANQTTGIYIYKLIARSAGSSFVQMKKMTLVK